MDSYSLPAGELLEENLELDNCRQYRRLTSGKFFKYDSLANDKAFSYTSSDSGLTWERGGELMSYRGPI